MNEYDKTSKIKYKLITLIAIACAIFIILGQLATTLASNGIMHPSTPGLVYFGPLPNQQVPSQYLQGHGGEPFNVMMFDEYREWGVRENYWGIPSNVFAKDNFSLWCTKRMIGSYDHDWPRTCVDASISLYYAWVGDQLNKSLVYATEDEEKTTKYDDPNPDEDKDKPTWVGEQAMNGSWLQSYNDLRKSTSSEYDSWFSDYSNLTDWSVTDGYDGDMDSTLKNIAKLNSSYLHSYALTYDSQLTRQTDPTYEYYNEIAYIFTAKDSGTTGEHFEKADEVGLNTTGVGQVDRFYWTEKQTAMWHYKLHPLGTTSLPGRSDRGLSDAASDYADFNKNYLQYDETTKTDKYLDNIEVKAVDPEHLNPPVVSTDPDAVALEKDVKYLEDEQADTFIDESEATRAGLSGTQKEYNTYTYDNQYIDTLVDKGTQRYVLGPYYVDYTYIDQGSFDSFQGSDYELKWNAIENIRIYNQDGINIEDLGGKFAIVYDYDPENPEIPNNGEGEQATRISDEYFVQAKIDEEGQDDFDPRIIDGSESKAFESCKPFFIVIEGLGPDNIQDLYIKIDFQYLQSVDATMYHYQGRKWTWSYKLDPVKSDSYTDNFVGTYSVFVPGWFGGSWESRTATGSSTTKTYSYDIWATCSTEQWLMGIYHGGRGLKTIGGEWGRKYQRKCIVIRQKWGKRPETNTPGPNSDIPEPNIDLVKTCKTDGEALYGAKFKIKISMQGQDLWGRTVSAESPEFERKTDENGRIRIRPTDLNGLGISLKGFTGTVTVEYNETRAPAGHRALNPNTTITFQVDKGKITSGSNCTVKPYDQNNPADSNYVLTEIQNEAIPQPEIILSKTDKNGSPKDAAFDIHVRYKPDGKEEVNLPVNMLHGRTNKDGVLTITEEDIANLPKNDGIELLSSYTGTLTLEIVEVHVYSTDTSFKSSSFEVTFRYDNGKLVDYSEGYTKQVIQTMAYDVNELIGFVEQWAGQTAKAGTDFQGTIPQATWGHVSAWLDEYLRDKYDTSLTDIGAIESKSGGYDGIKAMTEEGKSMLLDALGALTTYLKSDDSKLDDWFAKNTTATVGTYQGSIQIVGENDDGPWTWVETKTPEAPINPLEMMLAGHVFLDDEETKATAHYADGLLGPGDQLLYGIEVELWDETEDKSAELIQKEGEIRVNPTVTDRQGYYEFRGMNPFHQYRVIFRYDGIEYTATQIDPQALTDPSNPTPLYNTDDWAVSSKGHEETVPSLAQNVTPMYKYWDEEAQEYKYTSWYWDPIDLDGIKTEIAEFRTMQIYSKQQYPTWEDCVAEVVGIHPDDKDIYAKLSYIKQSQAVAYARYNPSDLSGTYPHDSIGDTFLMDIEGSRDDDAKALFADYEEKYLYPGQLQVHLGLVERPRTDLELLSDIVETEVTINDQSTTYTYGTGSTVYSQYMYQSDYAFAYHDGNLDSISRYRTDYTKLAGNNANAPADDLSKTNIDAAVSSEGISLNDVLNNGTAYYGSNELRDAGKDLEYYITYKVNIKNVTNQAVKPDAFVTYFDESLELISAQADTNGANLFERATDGSVDNSGNYVFNDDYLPRKLREDSGYITNMNMKYAVLPTGCNDEITSANDDWEITMRFRVCGINGETPSEAFRRLLNTDLETEATGRIWDQRFYSEICGYSSTNGYLDADSRVGNFEVDTYEKCLDEYRQAVWNYENDPLGSANGVTYDLLLTQALQHIIDAREDDAWYVAMEVTDSGFTRIVKGNVWEAISNEIKTATNFIGNKNPLEFAQEYDLENITVELVEMIPEGDSESRQVVRARTKTRSDGSYVFEGYYPGIYTVRFQYGDVNDDGTITRGQTKMDSAEILENSAYNGGEEYTPQTEDYLPVNGQYYQSTLGNPDTDDPEHYWYKTAEVSNGETGALSWVYPPRYSDAYDDAYSRLTQMNSIIDTSEYANNPNFTVPTTNDETSSSYTYQGNLEVEGLDHTDRIYAYTSTMKVSVEYIREHVAGNNPQTWYPYNISNVDFGLTPRARTRINMYKNITGLTLTLRYTSNPEVYVTADFNIDTVETTYPYTMEISEIPGTRGTTAGEESLIVQPLPDDLLTGNLTYVDGLITLQIEGLELQNAAMLLKYNIEVDNDSEEDYIKYYMADGKTVAVAYYDEPTEKLMQYEGGELVYHNSRDCDSNSDTMMKEVDGDTRTAGNDHRLSRYVRYSGFTDGGNTMIQTSVGMLADYLDANMWYYEEQDDPNHAEPWKNELSYWEIRNPDSYNDIITSRHEFRDINGFEDKSLMDNTKAIVLTTDANPLLRPLNFDDSEDLDIYLSANLTSAADAINGSVSTDVGDTGASDFYNIAEIIRLKNTAGRVVDVQGYDSDGNPETRRDTVSSRTHPWPRLKTEYAAGRLTPTIGISKTYTVQIQDPSGLSSRANLFANLGIVFIGLVVLAGGIIGIKKFVIPGVEPKK